MIEPKDVVMVTHAHCPRSTDGLGQVGLVLAVIRDETLRCNACDAQLVGVDAAYVNVGGDDALLPLGWLFRFKSSFELQPEIFDRGE